METTFGSDSEGKWERTGRNYDSWNPDLEEEDTEENRHKDIVSSMPNGTDLK